MTLPKPKPMAPNIEIPPDQPVIYANLARIAHSPADIVLDFAHMLPGDNKARLGARILMSPLSAKLLYRALGENIGRYEAAFGEINVPGNTNLAEHLFRPHQGPSDNPPEKE